MCSVDLDFEFNVTVDSCMNSNFHVVDFYSLAQFTRLNFFKTLTPESTSISISLNPLFLSFLNGNNFQKYIIFLKNGHEKRLKYLLMVFVFIQSYLSSPYLGRMCTKFKACNQIQCFTPEYIRACDGLDTFCFNYQFKIFTISNIKRLNNKSFHHILLLLSGDITLNPGPKNNLQSLDSSERNVFKSKGLHLIHLNINNPLPKIDELRCIANSSNVPVIGISESKLDAPVLQFGNPNK